MHWLFTFGPTSLSCIALGIAIWSYVRVRRVLRGASMRSLAALSSEVAELMSASESLQAQQRKLSARVGMREVRERRAESGSETPANVGTAKIEREKLKEIARARGFKVS